MATVIDELVTILGIDLKAGVVPMVQKFSSMVEGIATKAAWASTALMAAATSAAYLATNANADSAEIEKFGRLTGISTKNLQGMTFAAEQAGGSAASLKQDLMDLTKSMSSPIPGEFNHALFMLGIRTRDAKGQLRSADQLLLDIADKFQKMNKQEQLQWASKIGLSDDTLLMLQMGRKEIAAFQKEAEDIPVIIDERQLKDARDFTLSLTLLGRVLSYIKQEISSAAGPVVKQVVRDLVAWTKENKAWIQLQIKEKLEGISLGFRRFWASLKEIKAKIEDLFPSLSSLVKGLDSTELTAGAVMGVLFILAATAVFFVGKWALLSAAVMAAVLLLEDLVVALQGGDSMIGRVIKSVGNLGKEFKNEFPGMAGYVSELYDECSSLAKLFTTDLVNGTNSLMRVLLFMGRGIEQIAGWVMQLINNFLMLLGFGRNQSLVDWLFGGEEEPPVYDPFTPPGEVDTRQGAFGGEEPPGQDRYISTHGPQRGTPPTTAPPLGTMPGVFDDVPVTPTAPEKEEAVPPPPLSSREYPPTGRGSFLLSLSSMMYQQSLLAAEAFKKAATLKDELQKSSQGFGVENIDEVLRQIGQSGPILGNVPASPHSAPQVIQVPQPEIHINQTIQSTNPVGAATESARQSQQVLQTLYPGGLVPVVN